jgi:hypothetical protein
LVSTAVFENELLAFVLVYIEAVFPAIIDPGIGTGVM